MINLDSWRPMIMRRSQTTLGSWTPITAALQIAMQWYTSGWDWLPLEEHSKSQMRAATYLLRGAGSRTFAQQTNWKRRMRSSMGWWRTVRISFLAASQMALMGTNHAMPWHHVLPALLFWRPSFSTFENIQVIAVMHYIVFALILNLIHIF